MKKLLKKIISENMAREAQDISVFKAVRATLAPFEGKPVSKRLASAVEAALGDGYRVYYDLSYGMTHLDIRKLMPNGEDGQKTRVQLPNAGTPYTAGKAIWPSDYSRRAEEVPGLDSMNVCHGAAAEERNKRRAALLADSARLTDIVKKIKLYNLARAAALQSIGRGDFPDSGESIEDAYDVLAMFDGEEGGEGRRDRPDIAEEMMKLRN